MKSCLLLLVVLLTIGEAWLESPPIVTTKSGQVRGYVKTLDHEQKVFIYEGIPFGKPPVGELRFQKPQPAEPWSGVYNATGYKFACLQPDKLEPDNNVPETVHFSEDCLFLTVYRPPTESTKKRPVMFWIHGGGFETGSAFSIAYDGSYISTLGDVIVVATNYRLGAFGFLNADIPDAQGNNGLYDQLLALKWVRDNIEAFGGDPNKVTIFGESAGGMSVGALVLSPLAFGYFQRAVMHSGAPNSYLGSNSKAQNLVKGKSLASKFNCSVTSMEEMVKCLRKVPAASIVEATKNARTNGETFEPVYGEAFMPVRAVDALKQGKFNKDIDFMFGVVANEGALFVDSIFPDDLTPKNKHPTITVDYAQKMIEILYLLFHESYGTEVAKFYTKDLNDTDKDGLRRAVGYAFGHYHLVCPTVFFGQYFGQHTPSKPVYSYRLVHPPSIPVFPDCRGYMGVCHGDDVMFLFGFPIRLRGIVFTEDDYQLSLDMIKAWTNFAHTGKPSAMKSVTWKPALDLSKSNTSAVSYMSLDIPSRYKMVDNYYVSFCDQFWKNKIFV